MLKVNNRWHLFGTFSYKKLQKIKNDISIFLDVIIKFLTNCLG